METGWISNEKIDQMRADAFLEPTMAIRECILLLKVQRLLRLPCIITVIFLIFILLFELILYYTDSSINRQTKGKEKVCHRVEFKNNKIRYDGLSRDVRNPQGFKNFKQQLNQCHDPMMRNYLIFKERPQVN